MTRIGRIRTIKPEFFSSPSTAKATPYARLLFIAMWQLADDQGRGHWNPIMLLGYAFPFEQQMNPGTILDLLREIEQAFGVTFYTHRGRRYYAIPSWQDHQRTGSKSSHTWPAPDDEDSDPDQEFFRLAEIPGKSHGTPRDPGLEQRNRGTEEQGNRGSVIDAAMTVGLVPGQAPPKRTKAVKEPTKPEEDPAFVEFWDTYGMKIGKQDAFKAWANKIRGVVDPVAVLEGVRRYLTYLQAHPNPPSQKHPASYLNGRHWEDEYPDPRPRTRPGDPPVKQTKADLPARYRRY